VRSRDAVKILHGWSWAHGFHGHSDDDGASETSEDVGMPGYAFLEQFGDAEEWDHTSNASVSSSMNTSSLSYRKKNGINLYR